MLSSEKVPPNTQISVAKAKGPRGRGRFWAWSCNRHTKGLERLTRSSPAPARASGYVQLTPPSPPRSFFRAAAPQAMMTPYGAPGQVVYPGYGVRFLLSNLPPPKRQQLFCWRPGDSEGAQPDAVSYPSPYTPEPQTLNPSP